MDRSPGDAQAALFLGSAHLLRAQLRAAEKSVLPAAYEAKKSRKMLLRALQESGSGPDSCFGLGTYEYYADQLPSIVKGLRFLLFIPGGDREHGLEMLETAAGTGSLFRFEARIVLMTIYSGGKEQLYDDALRHAQLLLEEQDRSVTALHAVAKLFLGLHRHDQAAVLLEEALANTDSRSDTAHEVMAALHFQAALAEYGRFRPEAARVHLNWLLQRNSRDLPAQLAPEVRELVQRSRLMELAGKGSAVRRMMEGRRNLVQGEYEKAGLLLASAAANRTLPSEFRNRCRLLAGQAADLSGDRSGAVRWYREAGSEDAAVLYLRRPFTIKDGF
jgi:tetratricopeptide (TPR) repeat protein